MKLTELNKQQLEIQQEIETFLASLEEQDLTTEEQIEKIQAYYDSLEINKEELAERANAWCWVISKIQKDASYYREQSDRFSKMARAAENKAGAMKKYLQLTVEQQGGRLNCADFKLATRSTAAPVVIDSSYTGQIPSEYFKDIKLEDRLDKRYIKQALSEGFELPFARLGEKGTALFGVK
jgi:seryl-tRNA synthetase